MAVATATPRNNNPSAFKYNRRGFDTVLHVILMCAFLSIGIIALYDWKIGTVLFLLNCIYFITVEAVSARPDNNPLTFVQWRQRNIDNANITNCPILLCLGDSLTHGNCSASYPPEIPYQLSLKLGLPVPDKNTTFTEPIHVVNGGQNSITSHTVLTEQFTPYIDAVRPDYVVLLIGTNDIQSLCRPKLVDQIVRSMFGITEEPSLSKLESNLQQMIHQIVHDDQYQFVQFAICTLPPLGENLQSQSNIRIRQANTIIEQLTAKAACSRITLVPFYKALEKVILEKKYKSSLPYSLWWIVAILMNPIYHVTQGSLLSWTMLSTGFGTNHAVLSDGVHLNEVGRDLLVSLIVNDFLYVKNITKSIAVKKFR